MPSVFALCRSIATLAAGCAVALAAAPAARAGEPQAGVSAAEPGMNLTLHRRAGVVGLTLRNGVSAAVRAMPECGEVRLTVLLAGGELLESGSTRGFARAAAAAWEIPPQGDDPAASISVTRSLAPEGLMLALWCKPEQTRAMMDLAARMLRDPTIDAGALAAWRAASASAAQRPPKPAAQISRVMAGLLAPADDLRAGEPTAEQLNALSPEALGGWLNARTGQDPVSIALVGEVTIDAGTRLVAEVFADLPPRPALGPESFRAERTPAPPAGGAAPAGPVRLTAALTGSWPGSPQHAVVAYRIPDLSALARLRGVMACGPLLEARLGGLAGDASLGIERARVSVVAGRSYLGLGLLIADVQVSASADEHQLRRARDAVIASLEGLAEQGVRAEEFNPVRDATLAEIRGRLRAPPYWSALLPTLALHGLTPDDLADAPDAYARLTAAGVSADLRRWITPAGRIELLARP